MKYRVVIPLSRMHPKEGMQTFTHDDLIDIDDPKEAERMIAAGILAKPRGKDDPENADKKISGVEKAIKFGKKG